jgi:hypothetical protein
VKVIPPIDEATLAKLRIVEIEEQKEISQANIMHLTEVNKEVLDEYLLKPNKLFMMTHNFIKNATHELKL